jgi:hypothetical protein
MARPRLFLLATRGFAFIRKAPPRLFASDYNPHISLSLVFPDISFLRFFGNILYTHYLSEMESCWHLSFVSPFRGECLLGRRF